MGLFSKAKPDPQFAASQQIAANIGNMVGNASLPALPTFSAEQQAQMTPSAPMPASLPSYLGGGANTVYPAGLPNQLSMIADQLSAGGYGAPGDISAQLSGIYHPQTVAPTPPPIAAPAPTAALAAPASSATPVAAAAPAPAAAPAVRRPLGFTAQQQPRELNTTGGSLNNGPMFQFVNRFPGDLSRFLDAYRR